MSQPRLIDRQHEAERIAGHVAEPPALIILRGRRRIGKSFLLNAVVTGDRVLRYQADQQVEADHLAAVGRAAGRLVPGTPTLSFTGWDDVFEFVASEGRRIPLTVIFDEFQFMAAAQPALPSIIQRHWDGWQREGLPVTLILSGSALSFMEALLGPGAPLFGRADYRPLLLPLSYRDAAEFAPKSDSPAQLIERFAILGGTPQYQVWAGRVNKNEVIRRVLDRDSALYDEPLMLLRSEEELRSPGTYFSALHAVANGRTRTSEVADALRIRQPSAVEILARLERLGYLEQRSPITVASGDRIVPAPGARAVLRIADPYFRFWYRFVWRNRSRLDFGAVEEVAREIDAAMDDHVARVFEDCCIRWLRQYADTNRIGNPQEIGSWWSRAGDLEIDIVGVRGHRFTFVAECKWSRRKVGLDALTELEDRRDRLGGYATDAALVLFSRAGFTEALRDKAASGRVILFGAEDLFS